MPLSPCDDPHKHRTCTSCRLTSADGRTTSWSPHRFVLMLASATNSTTWSLTDTSRMSGCHLQKQERQAEAAREHHAPLVVWWAAPTFYRSRAFPEASCRT